MIPKHPIITSAFAYETRNKTINQFSCVLWRDEHRVWWGGIMPPDFRLQRGGKIGAQYIVRVTLKPRIKII